MTRRHDLAAFGFDRLKEIAAAAKGITPAHTPAERQAAYERFMRDDVRHFVSYVRRGVAHLAILQRNGAGRYLLRFDSTDPAFGYEHFDLNEREAEIHIEENDIARHFNSLSDLDVPTREAVLRHFRPLEMPPRDAARIGFDAHRRKRRAAAIGTARGAARSVKALDP